jgi:hypothetical protein
MQGIYPYIPETNHVPKEYNVAAILSLLFMDYYYYYYYYYYLLQLSFHSVAVVLTLVQTKQIGINIHKPETIQRHSTNIIKHSKHKHTYYQNTHHIHSPTHLVLRERNAISNFCPTSVLYPLPYAVLLTQNYRHVFPSILVIVPRFCRFSLRVRITSLPPLLYRLPFNSTPAAPTTLK